MSDLDSAKNHAEKHIKDSADYTYGITVNQFPSLKKRRVQREMVQQSTLCTHRQSIAIKDMRLSCVLVVNKEDAHRWLRILQLYSPIYQIRLPTVSTPKSVMCQWEMRCLMILYLQMNTSGMTRGLQLWSKESSAKHGASRAQSHTISDEHISQL